MGLPWVEIQRSLSREPQPHREEFGGSGICFQGRFTCPNKTDFPVEVQGRGRPRKDGTPVRGSLPGGIKENPEAHAFAFHYFLENIACDYQILSNPFQTVLQPLSDPVDSFEVFRLRQAGT